MLAQSSLLNGDPLKGSSGKPLVKEIQVVLHLMGRDSIYFSKFHGFNPHSLEANFVLVLTFLLAAGQVL